MPQSRYLRLGELARLKRYRLALSGARGGWYAGTHPAAQPGNASEFRDHRPYVAGDDPADIDWHVYARSDRLVIRRYEHSGDARLHLLVDASASMRYPESHESGGAVRSHQGSAQQGFLTARWPRAIETGRPGQASPLSKYDQASLLAVGLGFVAIEQQDRVGLALAHEGVARQQQQPVGGGFAHLGVLASSLEQCRPDGKACLARALNEYASKRGGPAMLVVCSDLHEPEAPMLDALQRCRHRGHQVVVFHILHPDEMRLPRGGEAMFEDSETGERVRLNPSTEQSAYANRIQQWCRGWRDTLAVHGVDYHLVTTDESYLKAIEQYLARRCLAR